MGATCCLGLGHTGVRVCCEENSPRLTSRPSSNVLACGCRAIKENKDTCVIMEPVNLQAPR